MKNLAINMAVLSVLGLTSGQVMAGLQSLPISGFSVTGGTSAYTPCTSTVCAVFPTSSSASPVAGYTLVDSTTSALKISDATHTNNTTIQIGTIRDLVWRNAAKNSCIFGTRISLSNTDYWTNGHSGTDLFVVKDISRGGFAYLDSSNSVSAGYYQTSSTLDAPSRQGRTFTSVPYLTSAPQPLIASAPTSPGIPGGTINTVQAAALRTNWVDFTTSGVFYNPVNSQTQSAQYYVQSTCDSSAFTTVVEDGETFEQGVKKAGILRFRQTANELIEITADGFVPSNSSDANF